MTKKQQQVIAGFFLVILSSGIFTWGLSPIIWNNDTVLESPQLDIASQATDKTLNLIIIWHQHQPSYKDPESGIYEQPWVFMHGINSYPYMADVLNDYPDINVTINLTPSMLQQLMDYVNEEAYDRRIELAKMPESDMSDENKSVVLQYFFDINEQFRPNNTRYYELWERRQEYPTLDGAVQGFTNQELLDLKTLFFAHWINPRYTTEVEDPDPWEKPYVLQQILEKDAQGDGEFTEGNKLAVINYAYEIIKTVIPSHNSLQDEGRLEIITTPFYHPILPLLIDLENARQDYLDTSTLPLPENNTLWPEDALAQIEKGKNYTTDLFGDAPVGMWPSEQAVTADIVPLVNQTGLEWFVTDYTVLQNSLDVNSLSPAQWFRPYRVEKDGKSSAVFFRHQQLSDDIGFNYGGLDPMEAAEDAITQLNETLQSYSGEGDPVFTVALDGENAWENYNIDIDDDEVNEYTGNLFREYFYQKLGEAQDEGWLRTITPQQYIAEHPVSSYPALNMTTGSWATTLNTWIGEPDENQAWDQIIAARHDLVAFMDENNLTQADTADAWEDLYAAEGSDWWWWYGSDQDSGHDELFDWQFKTILRGMYKKINWTTEEILHSYPLLFLRYKPPVPASIQEKYLPTIDGLETNVEEWAKAARYDHQTASQISSPYFDKIYAGVDDEIDSLHLRIDPTVNFSLSNTTGYSVGIYFSQPEAEYTTIFPQNVNTSNIQNTIGFDLATEVSIDIDSQIVSVFTVNASQEWDLTGDTVDTLAIDEVIEITIPLEIIGLEKGQRVFMSFIATNESSGVNIDRSPHDGPWALNIPFGGVDLDFVAFETTDPEYDEYGVYPTDPQMHPDGDVSKTGLMDIIRFRIGYKEADDRVYFEFKFRELYNPWNGPNGYSHPLMQVYIDKDNIPGSGNTTADQNAQIRISEAHAWEVLVRADGWLQYGLLPDGTQLGNIETASDSVDKIIYYSIPKDSIGMPTNEWYYTVVVGSQDYQQFRVFNEDVSQWKFGGGANHNFDPNIVDCLLPAGYDQETVLNSYDEATGTYAVIPAVGNDLDPPILTITTNITEYTIERGKDTAQVNISWQVSDNIGVAHIEVYLDGSLAVDLESDVSFYTINLTQGTYNITVKAYDFEDQSSEASLAIIVNRSRGIPGYSLYLIFLSSLLGIIGIYLIKRRK